MPSLIQKWAIMLTSMDEVKALEVNDVCTNVRIKDDRVHAPPRS